MQSLESERKLCWTGRFVIARTKDLYAVENLERKKRAGKYYHTASAKMNDFHIYLTTVQRLGAMHRTRYHMHYAISNSMCYVLLQASNNQKYIERKRNRSLSHSAD